MALGDFTQWINDMGNAAQYMQAQGKKAYQDSLNMVEQNAAGQAGPPPTRYTPEDVKYANSPAGKSQKQQADFQKYLHKMWQVLGRGEQPAYGHNERKAVLDDYYKRDSRKNKEAVSNMKIQQKDYRAYYDAIVQALSEGGVPRTDSRLQEGGPLHGYGWLAEDGELSTDDLNYLKQGLQPLVDGQPGITQFLSNPTLFSADGATRERYLRGAVPANVRQGAYPVDNGRQMERMGQGSLYTATPDGMVTPKRANYLYHPSLAMPPNTFAPWQYDYNEVYGRAYDLQPTYSEFDEVPRAQAEQDYYMLLLRHLIEMDGLDPREIIPNTYSFMAAPNDYIEIDLRPYQKPSQTWLNQAKKVEQGVKYALPDLYQQTGTVKAEKATAKKKKTGNLGTEGYPKAKPKGGKK